MALKSSVLTDGTRETAYHVLVEDDLAGQSSVREVPLSRCVEMADEFFLDTGSPLDELLGRIASVIAVRDYLGDMGEDPDFPTLG